MKSTCYLIIIVSFFLGCRSNHENMKFDINTYKMFFKNNFKAFNDVGNKMDSLELKNKVVSSSQYAQCLSSEISFKNLDGTKSVCWIKVDSLSVDNNTVYIEVNMPELRSNCTSFSYTYRAKPKYFKRSKRNVEYEMLENNWFLIIDNSNPCIE